MFKQTIHTKSRDAFMRISLSKRPRGVCLCLFAISLGTGACGVTKASVDTTVNFTSSTSPNDLFSADGVMMKEQKLNLFTAVTYENFEAGGCRRWWTVCECLSLTIWNFTREAG